MSQLYEAIQKEIEKRSNEFHDYRPGEESCEVKPINLSRMIPAIVAFFFFSFLLVYGMVSVFPRYFS